MPLFISLIKRNSFSTTVSFQAGNRLQSTTPNNVHSERKWPTKENAGRNFTGWLGHPNF